ncbi:hypothetical protein GGR55DRAFT_651289 [Xylaria sp. FL0064]|nr:hypothetical protein GGR55DRAFT_651289 [Xylaria sp. FL0064]
MVGLTVAMVFKLQTREHIKRKLAFIFTVGGLSGVIGFVKIGIIYSTPNDNGQENNANVFWDILQMATSIFCACAPMYKTIAPIQGVWARLKWSVSSLTRQSLLGSSSGKSSDSSKDRRPSDPRKDSGREMEINWGGLARRPQVAAGDSDVELVELQMASGQKQGHARKASRRFDEYDLV